MHYYMVKPECMVKKMVRFSDFTISKNSEPTAKNSRIW